jgi:hypothetical protein
MPQDLNIWCWYSYSHLCNRYKKYLMNNIELYLSSQSRNKIVIFTAPLNGIIPFDIGVMISRAISSFSNDKKLSLKVIKVLDDIFNSLIIESEKYGKVLPIKNPGILFERDLKIDILQLLDKYSRTNALFIQWEGEIENNTLYFLSKQKGQKIDIKNLSHIAI